MHRASIGDTLLATPVYRAIKECYPESRTVVVTSYAGHEMLSGSPYIDQLLPYGKGDAMLPIIKAIWRADAALILDMHYRNALLAYLARIPRRIGRGKKFLTTRAKDDSPTMFEPLKYMRLANQLGIDSDNLRPLRPMALPKEAQRVWDLCQSIRCGKKFLVVIAPYSLSDIKDWAPEKYRVIISRLKKHGCAVAIIGGGEQYARAAKDFPDAVNLAGKTNLRETAELIAHANLQICGCTAVLHICSATDTPVVAIYGPTSPEQWAPRKNCTVITHHFSCSPCYIVKEPCAHRQCLRDISIDEVWAAVLRRLG